MFKKPLKTIGVVFVASIVIYICFVMWLESDVRQYKNKAIPFLQTNLHAVVSWDVERLAPLLTPKSREKLETESVKVKIEELSKLGTMISIEDIHLRTVALGTGEYEGDFEIGQFEMLGRFEAGDVNIIITLATIEGAMMIKSIYFNFDDLFN